MARYISQHLFDALVIERMMAELARSDEVFNDLLDRYRDAYPDEDISALLADVNAAASQSWELLVAMPAESSREKMAVLQRMLEVLKQGVHRDKPLWRRMVENFFMNVQSRPIADRVHSARAHLLAARDKLLAAGPRLPVP